MSSLLQLETRKTIPVDFSLLNEQALTVLYITDDAGGQTLRLEISNSAGEQLDLLAPPADNPAQKNNHPCHFELVFRPGVLSEALLSKLSVQEINTKLSVQKNANGTVSLQLTVPPRSLQEGEKVAITLLNVVPDGRLGSRGTRVMLRYYNAQVHGMDKVISGFRETHLNIVNHQGKPTIPLHFGVVGAGRVLNNGVPNSGVTTLRISNTSSKATIQPGVSPQPASFYYLSMQAGKGAEEWALGTPEALKGMSVQYFDGHNWQDAKCLGLSGLNVQWQMPVPPIAAGAYTDIRLGKIVTTHPAGLTNVTLQYENIPGYWDGQFVTTLEKSPIVFTNSGQVGIGGTPTAGKLHVFSPNDYATITAEGAHQAGTWLRLVNTSKDGRVWSLISSGPNNGEGAGNLMVQQDVGGPIRLLLNGQGQLGLGTSFPKEKLQLGDLGAATDTHLAIKTTAQNKAGLKLRHSSEDSGYDIVSDNNNLQIISRSPKAAQVKVSGDKYGVELVLEADTDNNGDAAQLTITKRGGNIVGKLGFLGPVSEDFVMLNESTQTSVNLNHNGNAHLASRSTLLAVQGDGNVCIYRTGNPNAVWCTGTNISDINLKTEIQPIASPLERLTSLSGISFRWKDQTIGKERELGLIAQEVEQVFPELMHHLTDQDTKMVQYEKFVPVLVEAVKEQQLMIQELREQVRKLAK